jgi:hypothetical protein
VEPAPGAQSQQIIAETFKQRQRTVRSLQTSRRAQ